MERKLWRKPKSLSNKIGVTAKVLNMLFSLINMGKFSALFSLLISFIYLIQYLNKFSPYYCVFFYLNPFYIEKFFKVFFYRAIIYFIVLRFNPNPSSIS
jgi:hypothetical protein